MKNNPEPLRPNIRVDWVGTVDQDRRLEISAEFNNTAYELLSVVADEIDESLWVEFFVEGKCLQIPFHVLADAVKISPEGVHSEAWYAQHVYSKQDNA